MLRLSQARRKDSNAGEPIENPFSIIHSTASHIRRGQLSIIAGGPGTGKSAVIQNIIQRGNGLAGDEKRVNTCLYFSADSDAMTMFKRSVSIETGWEQDEVERLQKEGRQAELDAIVDRAASHIEWQFRSSPEDSDVHTQVLGYLTKYGAYPQTIIMDNVKNLFAGGGGEFEALEANCEFLHELAKETGAAVIGLHHVVGEAEDGTKPIPMSGLRGKISKTPAVIWTLHRTPSHLNISPVKNRNGKANASGAWTLPILADLGRMQYAG
jgi:replicative DNA helicase